VKYGKKLVDFVKGLEESEELKQLGKEVQQFATQFSIPGV